MQENRFECLRALQQGFAMIRYSIKSTKFWSTDEPSDWGASITEVKDPVAHRWLWQNRVTWHWYQCCIHSVSNYHSYFIFYELLFARSTSQNNNNKSLFSQNFIFCYVNIIFEILTLFLKCHLLFLFLHNFNLKLKMKPFFPLWPQSSFVCSTIPTEQVGFKLKQLSPVTFFFY